MPPGPLHGAPTTRRSRPLLAPNAGQINAVSVVSPNLAFAIAKTAVLRWDGSSWTTMPHPSSVTAWLRDGVVSISAISATEVYATFGPPEIWLYDGATWRVVGTTAPSGFYTFAAISVVPGFGIASGYDGVLSIGTPPGGAAAALQRFMRDRRR